MGCANSNAHNLIKNVANNSIITVNVKNAQMDYICNLKANNVLIIRYQDAFKKLLQEKCV